MATILVQDKSGAVNRVEVDKSEISLGRMKAVNDVVLGAANVSKRHARVTVRGDQFVIEDLQSTCGTFVNGSKIAGPRVLEPGDKVFIGDFVVEIEQPGLMDTMSSEAMQVEDTPAPAPAASRPAAPVPRTQQHQPVAWSAPPPPRVPVQAAPPEAATHRASAPHAVPRPSGPMATPISSAPLPPDARSTSPQPGVHEAGQKPAGASADLQAVVLALADVVEALHHIVTDGSKRVTMANKANNAMREVRAALASLQGTSPDKAK